MSQFEIQGNAYRILELPSNATPAAIKASYRHLVAAHHPDRHTAGSAKWEAANGKTALINEAYAILKDPMVRAEYDRWLDAESYSDSGTQQPAWSRGQNRAGQDDVEAPWEISARRAAEDNARRQEEARYYADLLNPPKPVGSSAMWGIVAGCAVLGLACLKVLLVVNQMGPSAVRLLPICVGALVILILGWSVFRNQ